MDRATATPGSAAPRINPAQTQPDTPARDSAVAAQETPLEAIASMCVILVIGLFIFGFVFQNFDIPSGSMKNTLLIGDHIVANRIGFAPPTRWAPFVHYRPVQRGDIIVFLKPDPVPPDPPEIDLVKRAIAVAGDRIHLEHGVVFLNGVAQREPYALQPRNDGNPLHAYDPYRDDFPRVPPPADGQLRETWMLDLPTHIQGGDLVVPPGKVFAMGDNRTESADSRYWGFVPVENILGRPSFVYWSFNTPADQEDKTSIPQRLSFLLHQLTHFFTETRWSRTTHVVR